MARKAECRFYHHDHERHQDGEPDGHDGKSDVPSQKPEEGRQECGAHIGARHLDADDGARVLRAEVEGRRMDDGRVDGRAAEPDDDERRKGEGGHVKGKEQNNDPDCRDAGAEEDEPPVPQLPRDKAA